MTNEKTDYLNNLNMLIKVCLSFEQFSYWYHGKNKNASIIHLSEKYN